MVKSTRSTRIGETTTAARQVANVSADEIAPRAADIDATRGSIASGARGDLAVASPRGEYGGAGLVSRAVVDWRRSRARRGGGPLRASIRILRQTIRRMAASATPKYLPKSSAASESEHGDERAGAGSTCIEACARSDATSLRVERRKMWITKRPDADS